MAGCVTVMPGVPDITGPVVLTATFVHPLAQTLELAEQLDSEQDKQCVVVMEQLVIQEWRHLLVNL